MIGTSHVAKQSINALKRKILHEKPGVVCVELDPVRLHDLLTGKARHKPKLRDIRGLGLFGWLFSTIGARVQKRLGKRAGATPGSDMKAAVLAGRAAGSHVVLIDRNIGVTVRRMSHAVPLREKLRLGWFLLFGWLTHPHEFDKFEKIDLKRVPGPQVVHQLVHELRHKFPNIYKVLVAERNQYMARKVRLVQRKWPQEKILVVVGAGHVEGMKRLLEHNNK